MLTTILLGFTAVILIILFVDWDARRILKGKLRCKNCGGALIRQEYGWYSEKSRIICPNCIIVTK